MERVFREVYPEIITSLSTKRDTLSFLLLHSENLAKSMADHTPEHIPMASESNSPKGAPSKDTSIQPRRNPPPGKVLDLQAIVVTPRPEAVEEGGRVGRTPMGRPNPHLAPTRSRSQARSLSPRRAISKGKGVVDSPRPTTGQIRPKVVVKPGSSKKLFDGELPTPTPKEEPMYIRTAAMYVQKSTSSIKALTPGEKTPDHPIRYKIKGVRTPQGFGKQLIPPLAREEYEHEESVHSTPKPVGVRRRHSPPPITGPPGQMEHSAEEEETMASLREELADMKAKCHNLAEQMAELEIWRMETDDKMETLRKALCAKVKRLASECGRPDLYDPPAF